jgi:C-terminal processing protease CtpA/Prc
MVAALSAAPVALADDQPAADPWSQSETFEWMSSSEGARLGVMVMSLTPELRTYFGASAGQGVLVAKVEPNSAAAKAGIKVGDVIVEVKGVRVDDASDVISALADTKQGDKAHVEVIRDKKRVGLDAVVSVSKKNAVSERPDWVRKAFPWFDSWRGVGPRPSSST